MISTRLRPAAAGTRESRPAPCPSSLVIEVIPYRFHRINRWCKPVFLECRQQEYIVSTDCRRTRIRSIRPLVTRAARGAALPPMRERHDQDHLPAQGRCHLRLVSPQPATRRAPRAPRRYAREVGRRRRRLHRPGRRAPAGAELPRRRDRAGRRPGGRLRHVGPQRRIRDRPAARHRRRRLHRRHRHREDGPEAEPDRPEHPQGPGRRARHRLPPALLREVPGGRRGSRSRGARGVSQGPGSAWRRLRGRAGQGPAGPHRHGLLQAGAVHAGHGADPSPRRWSRAWPTRCRPTSPCTRTRSSPTYGTATRRC